MSKAYPTLFAGNFKPIPTLFSRPAVSFQSSINQIKAVMKTGRKTTLSSTFKSLG